MSKFSGYARSNSQLDYFRISLLQIAVDDSVWILDMPELRTTLAENQWIAFFKLLFCSDAMKLGR